jgi:hypothetical protein
MFKEVSLGKMWSMEFLRVKLTDETVDRLNQEADRWLEKDIDLSYSLAGEIKQGKQSKIEFPDWFDIKDYVARYITRQFFISPAKLIDLHMQESWIVSQYAGDYNPVHAHGSDISAILYLKVPPQIKETFNTIGKNGQPCVDGCIHFILGNYHEPSLQNFGPRIILPEVGDMYIFPGYIQHTVYPFRGTGERRCIAFNMDIRKANGR